MITLLVLAVLIPLVGTMLTAVAFILWAVASSLTHGRTDGGGQGGGGTADPS